MSCSQGLFSPSPLRKRLGNEIGEISSSETVDRQEIFAGKIFACIIKYKNEQYRAHRINPPSVGRNAIKEDTNTSAPMLSQPFVSLMNKMQGNPIKIRSCTILSVGLKISKGHFTLTGKFQKHLFFVSLIGPFSLNWFFKGFMQRTGRLLLLQLVNLVGSF